MLEIIVGLIVIISILFILGIISSLGNISIIDLLFGIFAIIILGMAIVGASFEVGKFVIGIIK